MLKEKVQKAIQDVRPSLQADGDVVVIVLANLDPPIAEQVGTAIAKQLAR